MRIAEMKDIAESYNLELHQEHGWHLIEVDDSESLVLDIHVFAPGRYSAEQFHQVCRLAQQLFYPQGGKYFDWPITPSIPSPSGRDVREAT